ncbi:UNVERIFIED_CONTAM: hypothetical protein GTU68_028911 [Idotea baltica]|nr:hypothetical protein [Idotea baltica]
MITTKQNNCFIIAELSANHQGDINVAIETIKAAKRAGADAVKLQTYTADTITLDGRYLYDLYKEAFTPWEWHEELFRVAKDEGLVCFSSPFDFSAVDFLETLNTPIYKIASFEITDIPLIEYVASKGKPIIISTGIATIEDIELAIKTCKDAGNNDITILKCTSQYPAKLEDANLLTIPDIESRFGVKVGLSDHTLGITAPAVAVVLGAKVIEKHIILDKSIGGPDAHFSLDEGEFKLMVDAVRQAESALGHVDYELTEAKKNSRAFSRSLFVVKAVKAGEVITKENVRSIRPGFGMHPKYYNDILGKSFSKDVQKGEPLESNMIL